MATCVRSAALSAAASCSCAICCFCCVISHVIAFCSAEVEFKLVVCTASTAEPCGSCISFSAAASSAAAFAIAPPGTARALVLLPSMKSGMPRGAHPCERIPARAS